MNNAGPQETKVLSEELPEARLKELAQAVGEALLKGEDAPKLTAIDPDGETLAVALEKAVKDVLAISPMEELFKAWTNLQQVRALVGPEGPKDGKPRKVAIASHSLKASFTPHIVIELGKLVELRKVPVPVNLTLKVEGLIITVTDREVVGIDSGRAKPSVEAKVEGISIFKQDLPPIDLPLEIMPEVKTPKVA